MIGENVAANIVLGFAICLVGFGVFCGVYYCCSRARQVATEQDQGIGIEISNRLPGNQED